MFYLLVISNFPFSIARKHSYTWDIADLGFSILELPP